MKATNPVLSSKLGTQLKMKVIVGFIIYFNDSNYFGVCECRDDNNNKFIATGKFPMSIYEGQSYEFEGEVVFQRGQQQLAVKAYKSIMPFDKNSTIAYLATLPGINSKAVLIYQQYGTKSIEMLKTNPAQVVKDIKGIGKKTAQKCQEALLAMNISEASILKLLEYGLTPQASRKLYDMYGDDIIKKIEANPYFLLRAVRGYGFNKCDALAEQVGYSFHGQDRIKAGIEYSLELAQQEGHCYLPATELVEKACDILSKKMSIQSMTFVLKNRQPTYVYNSKRYTIDLDKLEECYNKETKTRHFGVDYRYRIVEIYPNEVDSVIEFMVKENRLILDDNKVYLPSIYKTERYAEKKVRKMTSLSFKNPQKIETILDRIQFRNKCILEPEQIEAIETFTAYNSGVFVLSGSAGCGKTFTMKMLLEVEKELNPRSKFMLLAPTGKAAKVLQAASGYECKTIHRGLEYIPEVGFMRNEGNPLDADIIVIDETSMLDIELLYHLLRAVKSKTKLIFLGDVNQLQSVGCGNVLHDFIKSRSIELVELTTIKRQSEDSGIIVNANNIIRGEQLVDYYSDFLMDISEDEEFLMERLVDTYMGLVNCSTPIEDIQILTPQKNNTFGTYALNHKIQSLVNGHYTDEIPYKTVNGMTLSFREGDKVIHTKNNYDKTWYRESSGDFEPTDDAGVFNGDCGKVVRIYANPLTKKKEMFVKYDDKYILYANDDFDEVELAYALTIHKSQGSEWPYVLIPLLRQHYAMLNRHLFYTAITRGKIADYLFAQSLAVKTAINKSTLQARYTNLLI